MAINFDFLSQEICYRRLIDEYAIFMDFDLREKLHNLLAPCSDEDFMHAYFVEHLGKFHEVFNPFEESVLV